MTDLELLGKLDGTVEAFNQSLIKIDKALHGNGQPGVLERVTRIEENIEALSKTVEVANKSNSESIERLTASVSELKDIVKTHANDAEKHNIIKQVLSKKEIAFFFIAGFIVLHTLIEDVPLAWKAIAPILGLPTF